MVGFCRRLVVREIHDKYDAKFDSEDVGGEESVRGLNNAWRKWFHFNMDKDDFPKSFIVLH